MAAREGQAAPQAGIATPFARRLASAGARNGVRRRSARRRNRLRHARKALLSGFPRLPLQPLALREARPLREFAARGGLRRPEGRPREAEEPPSGRPDDRRGVARLVRRPGRRAQGPRLLHRVGDGRGAVQARRNAAFGPFARGARRPPGRRVLLGGAGALPRGLRRLRRRRAASRRAGSRFKEERQCRRLSPGM